MKAYEAMNAICVEMWIDRGESMARYKDHINDLPATTHARDEKQWGWHEDDIQD